jgi:hypothetical protein
VVAPVLGIRSASTFSQPHPYDMDETMVDAAEYASYDRVSSELSGTTSDVSCPSRGWTSVAATERHEPARTIMAILPGCYVCYGKNHFLSDCPLLSTEVRQKIALQRAQKIQQDRLEAPQAVVNPHFGPRMLSRSPTVSPLAPPLSLRGRHTCLPRRGAHVRVTPVVVVPNRPPQS